MILSEITEQSGLSPLSGIVEPLCVTFLLPGRGRSGGIRVTVEMANRLLRRGHNVRIAWREIPPWTSSGLRKTLRTSIARLAGHRHMDWVDDFQGVASPFIDLNDLGFEANEIVIAAGSMTVSDLRGLRRDVIKVRYCHGFSENQPELTRRAWNPKMHTIAVSRTLLPRLGELCGMTDVRVVPNGVDTAEYYPESQVRDGVGAIFSRHYLKAPEHTLEIMERVGEQWPNVPRYIFGEGPRPKELHSDCYWRLPSIDDARRLYSRSRVWILTSRSEGLPAPVLEAMACGCVVVSTNQAGSAEIIRNGENGFLVPVGDTSAFLERIELLLQDEGRRRVMAQAGLETARSYSWEEAVLKMEDYLCSLRNDVDGEAGGDQVDFVD